MLLSFFHAMFVVFAVYFCQKIRYTIGRISYDKKRPLIGQMNGHVCNSPFEGRLAFV